MDNKINWGITKDLQADIRYEPNACKNYVMDMSLGCPHHCLYCIFSPLEMKAYQLQNPDYKEETVLLKLDRFLEREDFPPCVYLSYSSDPLGNEDIINSTITVVNRLLEHNVNILFVSKGIFTDGILEAFAKKPQYIHVQVDVTSADQYRNSIVEPYAASYEERMNNVKKLASIKGLGNLNVRIDPMLPNIDDQPENIKKVAGDALRLGATEVIAGYVLVTGTVKQAWMKNEFLRPCAEALSEVTPTISGQQLFSLPFDDKLERLTRVEQLCKEAGIKMACCGCKDVRLKQTDFEWICHPFNRQMREKMMKENPGYVLETEHLK